MARRRSPRDEAGPTEPGDPTAPVGRPELIFLARAEADFRISARGVEAATPVAARGLAEILDAAGAEARPLFGPSEERVRAVAGPPDAPDLAVFYHVRAPRERLEDLAESLLQLDEVEAAYVKPPGEPPAAADRPPINDMEPSREEPPAATPDFTARQVYLDPSPAGLDARYAWRFRGGRGAGVNIIDCEWGWRFTHEDLMAVQGGVVIGAASSDDDHGTAVLGVYSGDRNGFGIVGVCPDARASAASFLTLPTATVIRQAADRLRAGDILLLEIHRPGPDAGGFGQDGYIAIEWWPDDFAAIRYAVSRGVIVVEAAGNGGRDLDAAVFGRRPAGFPDTWRNPFDAANPDSGAIVVGAGAPPPGTHGRDHGPDRSRLDFSNHGARVDAQGWGREVTTTGYGDLQGGSSRDLWYTDQFSGTSSASPMIVGALGCLQGVLRARGLPPLTPAAARDLLRATGAPQQDAPGRPRTQRIGNRPDLRAMIGRAVGPPEAGEEERSDSIRVAGAGGAAVVINVNSPGVVINVQGRDDS